MEDYLLDKLVEFIIVVVASLVAAIIVLKLEPIFRKPKIDPDCTQDGKRLGFTIQIRGKTIKDAQVICNKTQYPWEIGTRKQLKKNIFPGEEPPSVFYPFTITKFYVEGKETTNYRNRIIEDGKEATSGAVIIIKDRNGNEIYSICEEFYRPEWPPKPKHKREYIGEPFEVSIRVIGEGIDDVRNVSVKIGVSPTNFGINMEGKPVSKDFDVSVWAKHGRYLTS